MANSIVIDVELDEEKLRAALNNAEKDAKNSGKRIGDNFGKNAESGILSSFAGFAAKIGGVLAAGLAVRGAFNFAERAVSEAAQSEAAILKLNQSLANAGTFSKQASLDIQNFASEIQRTTATSDDAALSLVSLARNFSRTNEEAVKLTKAALDLSAATGVDASTAVEQLGRSLTGQAGRLSQTIPQIRGFTEEQLKAGAAIDLVNSRFGGSAAAEINTFSGRVTVLKNVFGDFLETLGGLVTQSPVVLRLIEGISIGFVKLTESLSKIGPEVVDNAIKAFLNFGQQIITYVVSPLELAANIIGLVFDGVKVAFQSVVVLFATFSNVLAEFVLQPLLNLVSQVGSIVGVFNSELGAQISSGVQKLGADIVASTQVAQAAALETQTQFTDELRNRYASVFDFNASEKLSASLSAVQGFVDGATPILDQFKNNASASLSAVDTKAQQLAKTLGSTLNNALAGGIAKTVQSFVTSLAKGSFSFEQFGKSILGIAGDIAIQLGTVLIGAGLGIEALKSLGGFAAIAAGIGLVAVGSILKSLSGGEGVSSSTSPAGGGVAGSIGGGGTDQTGIVDGGTVEAAKPATNVTVNVQGNILDRRQTGLELAEVINEAFQTNGVVVAGASV